MQDPFSAGEAKSRQKRQAQTTRRTRSSPVLVARQDLVAGTTRKAETDMRREDTRTEWTKTTSFRALAHQRATPAWLAHLTAVSTEVDGIWHRSQAGRTARCPRKT